MSSLHGIWPFVCPQMMKSRTRLEELIVSIFLKTLENKLFAQKPCTTGSRFRENFSHKPGPQVPWEAATQAISRRSQSTGISFCSSKVLNVPRYYKTFSQKPGTASSPRSVTIFRTSQTAGGPGQNYPSPHNFFSQNFKFLVCACGVQILFIVFWTVKIVYIHPNVSSDAVYVFSTELIEETLPRNVLEKIQNFKKNLKNNTFSTIFRILQILWD